MRTPRHSAIITVALVPLGTIVGHVVGYGLAGQEVGLDGSHSHLEPAAWLTSLVALAALGWVAGPTRPLPSKVPVAWLAAGQVVLFLGLESAEQLAWGHGLVDVLSKPAMRWGLLAQVVTAVALVVVTASARASGDRIRAVLAARPRRFPQTMVMPPSAVAAAAVRNRALGSSASERGPPEYLVSV